MRKINELGLALLEKAEGFSSVAYKDVGGIWTVGIGHTGPDVKAGQFITHDQAITLLAHDLEAASEVVENATRRIPLTDNQFSALVSFVFNVGGPAFLNSTLLRKLLALDYAGAAEEFKRWDKVKGQAVPGLAKRRQAELALFLTH